MTTFYNRSKEEAQWNAFSGNQILTINPNDYRSSSGFLKSSKILMMMIAMFAGLWNGQIFGQVSGYTAARTVVTYTPLTGFTNVCLNTACNGLAPGSVSLPFSFNFNGTSYNAIHISENGFITFGAPAPTNANATPISNTTVSGAGAISVWGFNNSASATSGGRSVRYKDNGNGSFSIEWVRAGSGSNLFGTHLDAMITLVSGTNTILFNYRGPGSYPVNGTLSAQVGLRGATNTDFRNLTTIVAAPGYGAVNTAIAQFTTSNYTTVNNTQITWTPPSFCTAPTTQASAGVASNITNNQCDISFTRGDGDAGVLVVARLNATVSAAPSGGTTYASPSTVFGSGTTTGTNNFVVYDGIGNGTSVATTNLTITNLTPGSTYAFDVYEYNSTGVCYKTPGHTFTAVIPLCFPPNTQSSAPNVTSLGTDAATITWTQGSGSGGDLVILRQGAAVATDPTQNTSYSASSVFGSGQAIGAGFVVNTDSDGSVSITNLLPSTTYYYSIYNYESTGPCYKTAGVTGSFTTASCSPTVQPSLISFCPEYTALNISANRGNGTHTLIVARAGSAVNADPAYNTSYTANAAFGSGSQIGTGNYVVYNGNAAGTVALAMTGLTPGTTYHFRMYEYNAGPNCYNLVSPATFSVTTRSSGVYTSSTTTQNTSTVAQNLLSQQIIGLQVVMGGGADAAATINSITFNTNGSTNVADDIVLARIFYTGTSSTFAANTQYGQTFTTFTGNLTATDNFALLPGTNYFWVAYDLKLNATLSNVLDATIVSFNLTDNSGTSTKTPSVTAPAGSRSIISSVPSGYCTPAHNNSVGDCVSSVSFAGTPYTGATACGNYVNNTAIAGPTVTPGSTYTLTYYADDFIGNTNSVYVDWNRDGDFSDSGEIVRQDGVSFSVSQSITVPLGAIPGGTRMRIVNRFPSAGNNPCIGSNGSSTSGITLDFTVNIAGASGVQAVSCATLVPAITTPVTYNQNAATTQLSATGSSLLWYTAATGGTGSATAPTPSSANTGTTMYYVSQNTGCESPRTQIAVNVTGSCGFNITAGAFGSGTISPSGVTTVAPNSDQTYTFTPDCGYRISTVLVNGLPVGTPTSYTFTNVTAPQSISVTFVLKTELCNGIDDDCDGLVDEGCPPPLNENPATAFPTAISGNIFPNCGLISGTLVPATHAVENVAFAGVDVWFKFTAITNAVSITMNGTGQDNAIALYSNTFSLLPGNSTENAQGLGGSETLNYDQLTPGVEYFVSLGTVSGPGFAYTFCLKHLTASFCADGSGTYQLCSNLKAQFTGATNYTYNFTPTGVTGGSPVSFTGGGQLPLSTVALGLRYGGTYTVRIDANYNNLTFGNNQPDTPITILGVSICNITIAPHAQVFTKESQQCPATLLRGSIISGKPFVCAATSYTVEFTKVSDCVGTSIIGFPFEVNTAGASSNLNLSFSGPNQITNQSYYRVRWRPNFSYGAGDYGLTNYIFIGGAVMENTEELLSEIVGSTKVETSMIEANLYPNPNNGAMVNLNMTDVNSSDVFVRIMDGMGRVVYSNRYTVDGSFNTLVTFTKPLSSGLYMVEFTSGDQIITERMIVER